MLLTAYRIRMRLFEYDITDLSDITGRKIVSRVGLEMNKFICVMR